MGATTVQVVGPTDGTAWAEVRDTNGVLLGHVTTPTDGLDYQQFTARALAAGEFVYCTAHRFSWQEHAAQWVAEHARVVHL